MHSQCKRSVFIFISKRKLHLIAVSELPRTSFYSLPYVILAEGGEQFLYLLCFHV